MRFQNKQLKSPTPNVPLVNRVLGPLTALDCLDFSQDQDEEYKALIANQDYEGLQQRLEKLNLSSELITESIGYLIFTTELAKFTDQIVQDPSQAGKGLKTWLNEVENATPPEYQNTIGLFEIKMQLLFWEATVLEHSRSPVNVTSGVGLFMLIVGIVIAACSLQLWVLAAVCLIGGLIFLKVGFSKPKIENVFPLVKPIVRRSSDAELIAKENAFLVGISNRARKQFTAQWKKGLNKEESNQALTQISQSTFSLFKVELQKASTAGLYEQAKGSYKLCDLSYT